MASPLFDEAFLDDLAAMPEAEFTKFYDALSDDEKNEFNSAVAAPAEPQAAAKPAQVFPTLPATMPELQPGFAPQPADFRSLDAPQPGIFDDIGAEFEKIAAAHPKSGPAIPLEELGLEAASAIVNPIKRRYVDPVVQAMQGKNRAELGAVADLLGAGPETLDKVVGPGIAQGVRNLASLPFGDPKTYQSPEQYEEKQTSLARLGTELFDASPAGQLAQNLGAQPQSKQQYPRQTVAGAAAERLTRAYADTPLFFVQAGSGAIAQGLTGGFASELVSQEPEADPVRGAVMGAVVGRGLEKALPAVGAAARALTTEAKAVMAALDSPHVFTDLGIPGFTKGADAVAVVPAADVSKLIPAAGTVRIRAGAKTSAHEVRVTETGLETRSLRVSEEGTAVGDWRKTDVIPKDGKPVIVPENEIAKLKPGQELSGNVIFARDSATAADVALAQQGDVLDMAVMKETPTSPEKVLYDESGIRPLDELPEEDFLVARLREGEPAQFRVVKARNMQIESLDRRVLAEVQTPDGPKLGYLLGQISKEGENVPVSILAPEKSEGLVDALESTIEAPRSAVRRIHSRDEFNRILDARREAREAAQVAAREAETSAIATEAAQAGLPVVPTRAGPRIQTDTFVGQPPPQAPPPQNLTPAQAGNIPPPIMMGGDGVPTPPGMPPVPAAPPPGSGLPAFIRRQAMRIADILIPPQARGKRGELTWPQAMVAAEVAARSKSADVLTSNVGRILSHLHDKQARWLKAETAGKTPQQVAAITKSLEETLDQTGREFKRGDYSLSSLKAKFPQVSTEMGQFVSSWKELEAGVRKELQDLGWNKPLDPATAPAGLQEFMDRAADSTPALAEIYLAQALGPKHVGKVIARNAEKTAKLKAAIKRDLLASEDIQYKAMSPEDLEARAAQTLADHLKDPMRFIRDSRMRDTLAKDLIVFQKTLEAWTGPKGEEFASSATQFVRGQISAQDMAKAAMSTGVDLAPADIKFLSRFRDDMKKALKPWQLEALGHVTDPFTNMSMTLGREFSDLQRAKNMKLLRDAKLLQSAEELKHINPAFLDEGWVLVPTDPEKFGPYARFVDPSNPNNASMQQNYYLHPDAAPTILEYDNALKDFKDALHTLQSAPGLKELVTANQLKKLSFTVGNPASWGLNIFSNATGVAFRAGISPYELFRYGGFSDAVMHWREYAKNPVATSTEAGLIREGMERGLIGSDAMSAELKPLLQILAKDPAALQSMGGFARALSRLDMLGKATRKAIEAYAAIDSIAKYGTWVTMMKKAGADLKAGTVDAKMADIFINGRKGQASGQAIPIPTNDAARLELVKRTAAFRVSRSFALPDRPAKMGEVLGGLGNATLGTAVNDFSRVAVEEARAWGQLPYRMATEPGVASAAMQWGAVVAGAAGLSFMARDAIGLDQETVDNSFAAMPTALKAYAPARFALFNLGSNGEVASLDLGRFAEPFRWMAGDYLGRPAEQQLQTTPGQLAVRMLYNAAIGQFAGSTTGPALDTQARNMGLDIHERYTPPAAIRGIGAGMEGLYNWAAPPIVKDIIRMQDAMDAEGDPRIPVWAPLVKAASLGAVTMGADPSQAPQQAQRERGLVNRKSEMKALNKARKRATDDDEREEIQQEKERLQEQINEEREQ